MGNETKEKGDRFAVLPEPIRSLVRGLAASGDVKIVEIVEEAQKRRAAKLSHPRFVGMVEGGGLVFRPSAVAHTIVFLSPDDVLSRPEVLASLKYGQENLGAYQWGRTRAFLGRSFNETIDAALNGADGAQRSDDAFATVRAVAAGFLSAHADKRADVEAQAKAAAEKAAAEAKTETPVDPANSVAPEAAAQ